MQLYSSTKRVFAAKVKAGRKTGNIYELQIEIGPDRYLKVEIGSTNVDRIIEAEGMDKPRLLSDLWILIYQDGYISFCPDEVFQRDYVKL